MCGASLLPGQARGTVNGAEILQQTTLGADLRLEMTKYDIKIQSMKLILLTTHTNPISYNIEIFLSDKNTKVKIEIKKKLLQKMTTTVHNSHQKHWAEDGSGLM